MTDRATLRDWTYAASHMTLIVIACACVASLLYIEVQNALHPVPLLEACPTPKKS